MELLDRWREPVELSEGEWRDPPMDSEGTGALGTGQLERDAPGEGPLKRGVAAVPAAQAEAPGRLLEVQLEAVGVGVEAADDPSEKPGRRGYDYSFRPKAQASGHKVCQRR